MAIAGGQIKRRGYGKGLRTFHLCLPATTTQRTVPAVVPRARPRSPLPSRLPGCPAARPPVRVLTSLSPQWAEGGNRPLSVVALWHVVHPDTPAVVPDMLAGSACRWARLGSTRRALGFWCWRGSGQGRHRKAKRDSSRRKQLAGKASQPSQPSQRTGRKRLAPIRSCTLSLTVCGFPPHHPCASTLRECVYYAVTDLPTLLLLLLLLLSSPRDLD